MSRRGFLAMSLGAMAGLMLTHCSGEAAADGPLVVPLDKGIDPRKLRQLAERGAKTTYQGNALFHIGMPVGGVTAGQLYLGGDGRLWWWDIDNPPAPPAAGLDFSGVHYGSPLSYTDAATYRPRFRQGFALRTVSGGTATTRSIDADGFPADNIVFTGQYPIGTVDYSATDCPLQITLEAFSPFAPLETEDSSLPATLLTYTLRNTSGARVTGAIAGFSESPVCLASRHQQAIRLRAAAFSAGAGQGVEFSAADGAAAVRPDIVFEDFESGTYDGWTVSGTAFGAGPVTEGELPDYMKRFGPLNVHGTRFVTSHDFRNSGGDAGKADAATGMLTSAPFTIARNFVAVGVGGGNLSGQTCINVLVDGSVVATATGDDTEPMKTQYLDVRACQGETAIIQIVDASSGAWGHVNCDNIVFTDVRGDVLFEDFEGTTYDGWTVTGTAFGAGPVTEGELPDYMKRFGSLNVHGARFVTSHDFRSSGGDAGKADAATGTLTSRAFVIVRRYVTAWVGGGGIPGQACVNVVVDGKVVGSLTGSNVEPMSLGAIDLHAYQGQTATIEIVDDATAGWGHINCDYILFTDSPANAQPVGDLADNGTFALAAFDERAVAIPSLAQSATLDDIFDAAAGPVDIDSADGTITGALRVPIDLAPGASTTVTFAIGWYFAVPRRSLFSPLQDFDTFLHHYSTRFASSQAVLSWLAGQQARLTALTRAWVSTWYADSTLPYWFLERTFAPASTAATTTCYRFQTGRFYAFEGVYCCAGTCEHVWNYAQSIARLFPDLERDTRERVDLGIAFHADSGALDYRGEADRRVAADGQCGTILRVYREHQMSPDTSFLTRVWPNVKKAIQYMIGQDGNANGILEGDQYNTLDQDWWGEIPWISGLYVAALRAGQAMATEMDDTAFANQCATLATSGTNYFTSQLWNAQYGYFIQLLDPSHSATNSNRGCYIDQMLGQTYAHQLGLPRVFPADKARTALQSIYKYNYLPDPLTYRTTSPIGNEGRIYAEAQEPGVLLCTWPFGGGDQAPGGGWAGAVAYFNEVWTGLEYQLAAHMFSEGLADLAMVVTQAIDHRYDASKRNPYNEIECSDHYSRAMMSHAVFLAACGYEHHGPQGHLGFSPKVTPENFACAFTSAAGWGRYSQTRNAAGLNGRIEVRHGQAALRSLAFETAGPCSRVAVDLDGAVVAASLQMVGNRAEISLPNAVTVSEGHALNIVLSS